MEKIISLKDFMKILEIYHFDKMADFAKRAVYIKFVEMQVSAEEASAILNGAKKKAILSSTDKKFIKINLLNLIKDSFSSADVELYKRIDEIDQIFKEYFRKNGIKQSDYTKGLKDCWDLSRRVNNTINQDAIAFTDNELYTFEVLARIYRSIAEHVNDTSITANVRKRKVVENENGETTETYKMVRKEFVRVADYIVSARMAELSDTTLSKLSVDTANDFAGFLNAITSTDADNSRDVFSKKDVELLLDKTISIISKVSAEKYRAIRDCLNEYIDNIKELIVDKESKEYEEFDKLTAKNIILKCGSLLLHTRETISFSLDFIMGKKMSDAGQSVVELCKSPTSKTAKYAKLLRQNYPDLRFTDMDLAGHLYFAKQSASHMTILTTSTLYKTTNELVDSLLIGLGEKTEDLTVVEKKVLLKNKGFDVDTIYGRDNLYEIFDIDLTSKIKEKDYTYKELLIKNVQTLSAYIIPSDLHKIVAHNFNLLIIENEVLLEKLEEIKTKSKGDKKKFVKLFHKLINAKYVINEETNKIGLTKVKGEHFDESDNSVDAPEKEIINVNLIGFEDVDEKTLLPIEENKFLELYTSVSEELNALKRYALASTHSEIMEERKHFVSSSVANTISSLTIDLNPIGKFNFKKIIKSLIKKINELKNYPEFEEKDRRYFVDLLEETVLALELRKEQVSSGMEAVDKRISKNVAIERDKKSRQENSVVDYDKALKSISELRNNRLIAKKFPKLISAMIAETDNVAFEREISLEDNARVRSYRSKNSKENLSDDLRSSYLSRKEIEYIDIIIQSISDVDFDKQNKDIFETKDSIDDITALNQELKRLKEQRHLKIRNIRTSYNERIKANKFSLDDDLEEIVAGNPFGKKLVDAIRKLDEEIKEIEEKIESLTAGSGVSN